MTQILTSPELKWQNPYSLPESLEGDWDVLNTEFTDPVWNSSTPPERAFDRGIEVAKVDTDQTIYVGYVTGRDERLQRLEQELQECRGTAHLRLEKARRLATIAPGDRAIFVAETDRVNRVVGRANIYHGIHVPGGSPEPYLGYFKFGSDGADIGRNTHRLLTIHAACLRLYGQGLHVDTIRPRTASPRPLEEALKSLVSTGLAEILKPAAEQTEGIGEQAGEVEAADLLTHFGFIGRALVDAA